MNNNEIKCTFSNIRYENKPSESGDIGKVQKDLRATNITIEYLADALVNGASFRAGVLYGRKADDWKQQQLFGLDFDHNTTIEEKYNKAVGLGLVPCFVYTTFSHSDTEHKFRMIFCNNTVITDGNLRDKLQATLMGIMEDADVVCKNRDRLFFGGKGKVVLYPSYDSRIIAEDVIEKYWNDEYEQFIPNAKVKKAKMNTTAASRDKSDTDKEYRPTYENLNVKAIKEHDVEYLKKVLAHEPIEFETKNEFWDYMSLQITILKKRGNRRRW